MDNIVWRQDLVGILLRKSQLRTFLESRVDLRGSI